MGENTAGGTGYDFFISFADDAKEWVYGVLVPKLGRTGKRFALEAQTLNGQLWLKNLQDNIENSRTILLILSPQYLTSERKDLIKQMALLKVTEQRQWQVIPILLKSVERELVLRLIDGIDLTKGYEHEERLDALLASGEPTPEEEEDLAIPPYPGMVTFKEEDASRFFGREDEIDQYAKALRDQHLLVLTGASGCGKSSLARAGIIPQLKAKHQFLVKSFRPSDASLAIWLAELERLLAISLESVQTFLWQEQAQAHSFLVLIDQFEELFAVENTERSSFALSEKASKLLSVLAKLRQRLPEFYLLVTVRAEFFPQLALCQTYIDFDKYLQRVNALGREGLSAAITKPALKKRVFIDERLVERLVNDAGNDPGILPFVQETLRDLWEKRYERYIGLEAYENLGGQNVSGLRGSITNKAEAAYKKLPSDEHRKIAKRIFIRLIQFNEDKPDTRRRQTVSALKVIDESSLLFEETLRHLSSENYRLLTIHDDEYQKEIKVDIVHEILIRAWVTLKNWIASLKEIEQSYRYLSFQSEKWEGDFKGKAGLLSVQQIRLLRPKWKLIKEYGVSDKVERYWQASIDYNKYLTYKEVIKYFSVVIIFSILTYTGWIIYGFYIKNSVLLALDQVKIHGGILPIVVETETNNEITNIQKSIKLNEFMIHKYEVNKGSVCKCIKVLECKLGDVNNICNDKEYNLPMNNINLADAQNFCEWLGMRLPLEIEWEMAAKNIDSSILLNKVNSNIIEVNNEYIDRTKDNIYGLYGNVSEWTLSEYQEDAFYSKRYWHKSSDIDSVTVKGTSAKYSEVKNYFYRVDLMPEVLDNYVGFRCVSNLPPEEILSHIE
ncbi:Formylglycine-generating enzyme, required for sulfatase activity, contains SUMF1/FGE domain [Thiothrix eikelboomii]|uniref:Formylglycine-generating enzyme, required for sulfatase activity, contains SUMF1/FGE domain n=1 Tax=Thiothrix eikelboomii TaxID=92487 RepID=A0A1T4W910_9GAMM|nr:SUMF1/EgtB/PvdO family nonheme iron enzyme [Thiothrix eikelboomii]SKA73756.1 Formylglycine-generating enzyme, required for sulfatase activity, contains SUMF1/FGE domain [Thiothrix eikelboomii]